MCLLIQKPTNNPQGIGTASFPGYMGMLPSPNYSTVHFGDFLLFTWFTLPLKHTEFQKKKKTLQEKERVFFSRHSLAIKSCILSCFPVIHLLLWLRYVLKQAGNSFYMVHSSDLSCDQHHLWQRESFINRRKKERPNADVQVITVTTKGVGEN